MSSIGGCLGGFCPMPLRLGGSVTEGWTASQHARASADAVAISRVQPFAWVTFTSSGDPAVPSIIAYNGMPGMGLTYAPTIVAVTDSQFSIQWDPVQLDAYERPEPLSIHHAFASIQGLGAGIVTCSWEMGDSNLLVFVYDRTGSPSFAAGAVTVFVA